MTKNYPKKRKKCFITQTETNKSAKSKTNLLACLGDQTLSHGAVVVQEGSYQHSESRLLATSPDGQIDVRIVLERVDRCGQSRIDLRNGLDPDRIFISVSVVSVVTTFRSGALPRVFSARGLTCAAGCGGHRLEVDAGEGAPARFGAGGISALSSGFGFDAAIAAAGKAGAGGGIVAVFGAEEQYNKQHFNNFIVCKIQCITHD